MREWTRFVRDRLGHLAIPPEREAEIVAELAQQVEQVYTDARAAGDTEPEAVRRAESHLGDWSKLAREIEAAERPADPVAVYAPGGIFTGAAHDARYALRFLKRNP